MLVILREALFLATLWRVERLLWRVVLLESQHHHRVAVSVGVAPVLISIVISTSRFHTPTTLDKALESGTHGRMRMDRINQLRKIIHIHSIIYYYLHTTIVPDAKFDEWANELVELQAEHPESQHSGYMPSVFKDWTGDTGMHLPITDEMLGYAQWAVEYHHEERQINE
jgi:hypothetical protein